MSPISIALIQNLLISMFVLSTYFVELTIHFSDTSVREKEREALEKGWFMNRQWKRLKERENKEEEEVEE